MKIKIPKNFMSGTSFSAWQIEGTAGKEVGQKSWADLFFQSDAVYWARQKGVSENYCQCLTRASHLF